MFQARDYSIFLPSPNAEKSFRALRWLDSAIKALFVILALLCLWNIGALVRLRLISNQDFGEISSITDDLSTRLIWVVAIALAGLVLYREWQAGVTTMGLLIPATLLLTLTMVPAVMSEVQPPLKEQTLRVVMFQCPPKAIVNDELLSIGRCDPRPIAEDDVLLAVSDPAVDSFTTIEASAGGQNTITYNLQGRGTYTVYFMFRFETVEQCKGSTILPRGDVFSSVNHRCVAYNGAVWQVHPHTTSSNQASGVHLIQVTLP